MYGSTLTLYADGPEEEAIAALEELALGRSGREWLNANHL